MLKKKEINKFLLLASILIGLFTVSVQAYIGSLDTNFNIGSVGLDLGLSGAVTQPDGKIIIVGSFTQYNNISRSYIARLNANGSLDTSFDPGSGFDSNVNGVAIQSDGKIVVVGSFTTFNSQPTPAIARINLDGTLDTSFNISGSGFDGIPVADTLYIQPDGKILVGGQFTAYNGLSAPHITRLNSDGSLDVTFNPLGAGLDGTVTEVALQSDNKIVLVGGFTSFNLVPQNFITRLNTDGSIDSTFATAIGSGFDFLTYTLAVQQDDKILVGGDFSTFDGSVQSRIIRLNSSGTIDPGFIIGAGFDGAVYALELQTNNQILVGSIFNDYNGTTTNRLVRLDLDGQHDTDFYPDPRFNTGSLPAQINKINIESDGDILIGGVFPVFYDSLRQDNIARLSSIDSSITVPDAPVSAVAVANNTIATVTVTPPVSTGGAPILYYIATSTPGNIVSTSTSVSIYFSGLNNRTAYTFSVAAVNIAGESLQVISNSVIPRAVLGVPGNIIGRPGANSANITYLAPTDLGDLPILYYIATSSPASSVETSTGNSISFSGLSAGTSYMFSVRAVDSEGPGLYGFSEFVTPTSGGRVSRTVTRRSSGGGGTPTYDGYITRASKYGQSGKYVTALQEALIKLKYASSTDIASDKGKFGDVTIASLKRFQAKYPKSLAMPTPTGKLDSRTVRKLNSLYDLAIKKSDPKRPSMKFTRFITTLGTIGPDVTALQKFLNNNGFIVMPVGEGSPGREGKYFGPATSAALKKWQIKNNLYPTGILDRLSVDRLNGM